MSVPSKSIDKNKRYAGVKVNDFVNKTRANERSRVAGKFERDLRWSEMTSSSSAPSQGWANLGKINSRRIPPPANLPSLKSETGGSTVSFDPIIPSSGTSHGWSGAGNQTPTNSTRPLTPSKQPTQQQLDSLPAHASTPPPPATSFTQASSSSHTSDLDRPRPPASWSHVTAGNVGGNANDHPPNLLGLNDFPRLVTQDSKSGKSSSDALVNAVSSTTTQGPSLRPANLSSWKEGGGRLPPQPADSTKDSNDNSTLSSLAMQSPMVQTTPSLLQQPMQNPNNSYMRGYSQQQQQQQSSAMVNIWHLTEKSQVFFSYLFSSGHSMSLIHTVLMDPINHLLLYPRISLDINRARLHTVTIVNLSTHVRAPRAITKHRLSCGSKISMICRNWPITWHGPVLLRKWTTRRRSVSATTKMLNRPTRPNLVDTPILRLSPDQPILRKCFRIRRVRYKRTSLNRLARVCFTRMNMFDNCKTIRTRSWSIR